MPRQCGRPRCDLIGEPGLGPLGREGCQACRLSTTKTAPATINQCAYCIAEPPSRSSFLHLEPELDQAANYHFALSFLTSLSSHPRKRSDPSRAYSCESRALQKGRTYRHAYRLPWPQ